MKAKVLVRLDREIALDAIRALDALGGALLAHDAELPKTLKKQLRSARRELVRAIGWQAHYMDLADRAAFE